MFPEFVGMFASMFSASAVLAEMGLFWNMTNAALSICWVFPLLSFVHGGLLYQFVSLHLLLMQTFFAEFAVFFSYPLICNFLKIKQTNVSQFSTYRELVHTMKSSTTWIWLHRDSSCRQRSTDQNFRSNTKIEKHSQTEPQKSHLPESCTLTW